MSSGPGASSGSLSAHPLPTCSPRLACDLVEVYFQIVHARFPLLNPDDFRDRFRSVTSISSDRYLIRRGDIRSSSGTTKASDPLHPALVAAVVAWGAKFTENTLFVADRQQNGGSKSLLAVALVDRARELAELLKVHRVSSPEHVIISLLLEPLQSRKSGLLALVICLGFDLRRLASRKFRRPRL